MKEIMISNAPIAGLLFFFLVFLGIAYWALRPSAKKRLEQLAYIPLNEDTHG